MPSRIPVSIDGQDFPSINRARLFYSEILHRHQPGQPVADPDQFEIRRLVSSTQYPPRPSTTEARIQVIQGKYGRHCFAIKGRDQPAQMISIMRSVRQCVSTVGTPESDTQTLSKQV